ncbi:hypothetical protein AN639_03350 [Candidatus Epulonipiscium fishelsonii]|uniref:Uncharacterized protein n=1 Tax=Candidatus Epulonipiscium fishelsonii TaxID=77094 RepID=A0ACC8XGH6_9FIRM|nr:hypothetical protein AN639_03350 [Epulopiscium sp. SCG-B05WGA-EpuloA1]ONI42653.1 hypothetical protein AN396_13805 [Epulopiscium sp. SCG-B11WGA-EpuloA1]
MKKRELISFEYAMKHILREEENLDILEGFLSALLKEDVTIVEILKNKDNKETQMELLIKDGKTIVVIQHSKEDDYLGKMIWKTAKTILDRNKNHTNIEKIISVNILYFNSCIGNGYIYKGETSFKDWQSIQTSELIIARNIFPEYYLINIENFDNEAKNELDEWIYFFKHNTIREGAVSKILVSTKERLAVSRLTDKEKQSYEHYLKENNTVNVSILKNVKQEGINQGVYQEKIEVAKKAIMKGLKIDLIMEMTGLPFKEIEKLISEYKI